MAVLVDRSVPRTLFSMALPMLAGTFAMNAYNLTDTWYVAQLGTIPLAAMGFTFPVVMLVSCVARGIGSGVTTLTAHAIGRHDHEAAARMVTHGLIISSVITVLLAIIGYFTIEPIFARLGADQETLPLIGSYMRTWYIGALFMALPMVGNGVLMSTGDARAASGFMIVGTVLNIVLDPIFIFGFMGIPAMGIQGAALATVIAQAISTLWLLRLLTSRHRLLVVPRDGLATFMQSAVSVSRFAVPGVLSMVLMPVSSAVITGLLATFGTHAVAAAGAAGRIEMFAFAIPASLGISLTPFISQNFGADRIDRVKQALRFSSWFAIGYGGFIAVVFFLAAPWLAKAFTQDPEVTRVLVSYIRIICFGYGMMEVHRYGTFFLTGLHHPTSASALNLVRVLALLIPLSIFGAHTFGIQGIFAARLLTDLLAGLVAVTWAVRVVNRVYTSRTIPHDAIESNCSALNTHPAEPPQLHQCPAT